MRILMMHNGSISPTPSGEQVAFDAECQALRHKGVDVSSWRAVDCEWSRSRWRATNIFWRAAAYHATRRRIREFQPDLVHLHGVLPHFTVAAFDACRAERVPVVQTLHNYRWLCVEGGFIRAQSECHDCLVVNRWQGVRRACARSSYAVSALLAGNNAWWVGRGKLFQRIDRFIAVSEYVRQQHLRAGFPPVLLRVKYNGVPLSEVAASWSPQLEPVVSFVGRLDPAKGTAILQQLPAHLPQVRWNIVGEGPDAPRLRQALAANPRVRFWGQLPAAEARHVISRSQAVVVPSQVPESFGLVAAEAMGCGVPVVVSRVGGLAELLSRSGGGLAVTPQAGASAFAQALHSLLGNASHWRAASRAGRTFAEAELSLDRTSDRLLEIYRELISTPAPVLT